MYRDRTGNVNYSVYSYVYLMKDGSYRCYKIHDECMEEELEDYREGRTEPKHFTDILGLVMHLASDWGDEPNMAFDIIGRYWIEFGMCNNEYIKPHLELTTGRDVDKLIKIHNHHFLDLRRCSDDDVDVIDFIDKNDAIIYQ